MSSDKRRQKSPASTGRQPHTASHSRKAGNSRTQTRKIVSEPEVSENILVRMWMAAAHGVGAIARAFSREDLVAKDDRRDGLPFTLFVLAVLGVIIEWFLVNDPIAQTIE